MTVDKKWMLAGGLALASLAVWAPRLLARSGATPPPSGDGGNAPAFLADALPVPEVESATPAVPLALPLASSGDPLERVAALESLLPRLRNFGVGRPRPALDALLAHLAPQAAKDVAASAVAAPNELAAETASSPLAAQFEHARVSACLVGARQSNAVLDGRVVRTGDELDGGVVVDAIRARSVVLRRGDERIEIALTRVAAPSTPLPSH